MTEIQTNGMELSSDPLADQILEIVNGATKYKIIVQCIEAGFFDALETIGEPASAELISKKFGYDVAILERLLNALISYKLILAEKNKKGTNMYKNAPSTSKYLTRSKKPTMIGLIMMNETICAPLTEKLPELLKTGLPKMDINKNIADKRNQEEMKNEMNMADMKNGMKSIKIEDNQSTSTNASKPNLPKHMTGMNMNKMPPMPSGMMPSGMMGNMPMMPSGMMGKMPMMPPSMAKGKSMDNPPSDMISKFIMSTDAFSCSCASAVVRAFDLNPHREAVDLGGGSGRISMELSKAYPNMKITMLDLPPVVQIAQKFFPHNTTDGRVQFKEGDFFEDEIPSADLYILGHVLHGWDDVHVDKLLNRVFAKLAPGGSLLVLEKVLSDDKHSPEMCLTNDLVLALMSKGQERSASEYRKLFAKHGYTNVQFKYIAGFNYCDAILVKKPF